MNAKQGTEEWKRERLGKITGTRFADLMGGLERRQRLYREITGERDFGLPKKSFKTPAMQLGRQRERTARIIYEAARKCGVDEIDFVPYDLLPEDVGCSPDGLVGTDGIIEIKCPAPKAHIKSIEKGVPLIYVAQIQGNMMVTRRSWCDYISFCPEHGEKKIHIIRVYADEPYQNALYSNIIDFLKCVKERVPPTD